MAYGKVIPDLQINGKPAPYPVVNERSIRAAAGLMFALGISAFWYIQNTGDYRMLTVMVLLFWLEFFLKTVFQPSWSIFGFIADFLVRKQQPEYVGAIQKRFAWSLGLVMASIMIVVSLYLGIRGWFPYTICLFCLTFMWLESACGICIGCKMYVWLRDHEFIQKTEHQPVCPGGVCSMPKK